MPDAGFADALRAAAGGRPLVLDGGMSNQLEADGHDLTDDLWSARLLADEPEAIVEAHHAYFRAGADVAITASYQATYEGFAHHGIDRGQTSRLLQLSVVLAREAADRARRDGAERPLWVAASAGPYGAMLADGSEYRGRYGLGVDELEAFHRPRLETLAVGEPDVFALETVPDADEARALVRAVRGLGVPAWLTYSVTGTQTRAGQPLEEAFAVLADAEEIVAVGVNCCAPEDVADAVRIAAAVTGKPVVVYPNSGEQWDSQARGWVGTPHFDPAQVRGWRANGAVVIGGCCRVGPTGIAAVAEAVGR